MGVLLPRCGVKIPQQTDQTLERMAEKGMLDEIFVLNGSGDVMSL
jgi:hypothetical protein